MAATAHCLDLTRLVSRLGRGPLTGVDRVELAYLRHLLRAPQPLYLLVRTSLGYLLLDEDGAREALDRFDGKAEWGKMDLIGRLKRRAHPLKRRAEADLRRWAAARCRRGVLAQLLERTLPGRTTYFNVGHSNLTVETLSAWRAKAGARIIAMVHDTIPLDHPEFQRPGTVESFRLKLTNLSAFADVIVCNSEATRADVARWMDGEGRVPDLLVAHLGVDLPKPEESRLPEGFPPAAPYFVTVGTIEPRKDHALLLDVWKEFGDDAPVLVIAGQRGWRNEQVFRRLDSEPFMGRTVLERGDLDDAALSALLKRSAGLLFPSMAEGYGLPPIEAAALGVPVVCRDLPVYRDLLGDIPVYLSSADVYLWKKTIQRLAEDARAGSAREVSPFRIPTWGAHFNRVLRAA